MKKFLIIGMLAIATTSLSGCQWAAKNMGGNHTIKLEEGQKLANITWKDSQIWYLTKPMTEEDVAEIYTFQEDSTMEMFEGTVTIVERK